MNDRSASIDALLSESLMSDSRAADELPSELQQRLADILDDYLISLEQGVPLDLDRITAEDPELAEPLREYLEGLAILQRNGPKLQLNSTQPRPVPDLPVAKQLGDFQLIREVGRGGMGVVYEARQLSLDRLVALKVLPFAAMLDEKQIARFENEARAAAQLHHPNIVPIHGVGSERGVHFYAMQLINGRSLQQIVCDLKNDNSSSDHGTSQQVDATVDDLPATKDDSTPQGDTVITFASTKTSQAKSLGRSSSAKFRTTQYIESVGRLMVQAADALHAAHEYGVIHRDVKPSNLMLDASGKLWVTDFGLARIQADASVTRTGEIIGTLHYMSPEQASGHHAIVDERTDVYSLGVTMYELLTLSRPFEAESQHEIVSLIEQGHYKKPRTRNPKISADLENVIIKAMAIDRNDRYGSAADLANDLRRFLEGKPTRAKRPFFVQRFAKWTKRHQRAVSLAICIMALAIIGLTSSMLLLTREKGKTETALNKSNANLMLAQDAIEIFVEDVDRMLEPRPDSQHIRQRLLSQSLNYYQKLVNEFGDQPEFEKDKANALTKMGSLNDKLGKYAQAENDFKSAQRVLENLVADDNSNAVDLVRCLNNLGAVQQRLGRIVEANKSIMKAVSIGEDIVSSNEAMRIAIAESWNSMGLIYAEKNDYSSASNAYDNGLKLFANEVTFDEYETDRIQVCSAIHNNLWQLLRQRDPRSAKKHIESAISLRTSLVDVIVNDASHSSTLAASYCNLASSLSDEGDINAARNAFKKAVELERHIATQEPHAIKYHSELASTLNNLGQMDLQYGDRDAAEQSFQEALAIFKSLKREFPNDLLFLTRLGGTHNNLGVLYKDSQRMEDAVAEFRIGIKQLTHAFELAPHVAQVRESLSRNYFNYCQLLTQMGDGYQAANVAVARRELWPDNARQLYAVANELTAAHAISTEHHRPTIENEIAITMKRAKSAGWRPDDGQTDGVLQKFKSHPTIKSIIDELSHERLVETN